MDKKINVFLFFLFVLGFPLAYFFMPKSVKSDNEKRKLATFPSFNSKDYLAGTWTKQVDKYIDDHFPFRTSFISTIISCIIRKILNVSTSSSSVPNLLDCCI